MPAVSPLDVAQRIDDPLLVDTGQYVVKVRSVSTGNAILALPCVCPG